MKKSLLLLMLCFFMLDRAIGVEIKNPQLLFRQAEAACEHGDYEQARLQWQSLAVHGNAQAQYRLGWMYSQGVGIKRDNAEAARWFQAAAEQGIAEAQFKLGFMYRHGIGVLQDPSSATRWYRQAAEQGHLKAQRLLASMYENGIVVSQDSAEARKWHVSAARNHQDSCDRLVRLYFNEASADNFYVETIGWLSAAPPEDIPGATLYQIGKMYEQGEGMPQNYVEATRWFCKAVDRHMLYPLLDLGGFYQHGLGVSPDPVVAYALFGAYIERWNGIFNPVMLKIHADTQRRLIELITEMSPRDLERGRQLKLALTASRSFSQALRNHLLKTVAHA